MLFPVACELVMAADGNDVMMEVIGVAMGQGVEIGAELVLSSR